MEVRVETERLGSSTGDAMLYSVFENEESLKGYFVHPEHVRVSNTFVKPYTCGRASFDYEE